MIFLDLLAPVARLLGDLWLIDLCTFTDVTIGLSRLQQLVRELAPAFEDGHDLRGFGHRALLAPAPGEQHTFGMHLVEEFLRRAGWDVGCVPSVRPASFSAASRTTSSLCSASR
ncbi:MAG: cobalamin B12-binding domain-containing protein [Myxococcales bacterium]|nr:cobalamin B12-binding domain-containing protein [Myxococcales bacterium]